MGVSPYLQQGKDRRRMMQGITIKTGETDNEEKDSYRFDTEG
jgi:hypothetical protein